MICCRVPSALSRVLRDPIIIPHLSPFVKRFSKSFSIFFKIFSLALAFRWGSARVLYHISFRLSRGFSKVFSTFFVISFPRLSPRRVPRGQLAYYSTSPSICQQVFAKFFEFGDSVWFVQKKGTAFVHNAHKLSVLVPNRGMIRIGNARFPRFEPRQAHVGVLRDHAHPPRRRTVNHEGLDELIVNI